MDPTLEAIATFIQSVGFPIAVAGFVLVRMEKTMGRLAEAVERLEAKIVAAEQRSVIVIPDGDRAGITL